ncbi:Uncharacterised protein [uncultured archaeon]|nr:Uncharacterised protein [uncultured archaeon]
MSKISKFFEKNLIVILTAITIVVTVSILVAYFPYLTFDSVTAANFFGNIVGGIISGVIVALALAWVSNIEERKRKFEDAKTVLLQLKQLLSEYSKDLVEKLNISLRPEPGNTSFQGQETEIKNKVNYFLKEFSVNKTKFKTVLSKLSFLEYGDFLHRLANYGKLKKDFGEKVPEDLESLLSDLNVFTDKLSGHYNSIYGKYVSGTNYDSGKQVLILSGKVAEKDLMLEILNQDTDLIMETFDKITDVKNYFEDL